VKLKQSIRKRICAHPPYLTNSPFILSSNHGTDHGTTGTAAVAACSTELNQLNRVFEACTGDYGTLTCDAIDAYVVGVAISLFIGSRFGFLVSWVVSWVVGYSMMLLAEISNC
jgi:hypothetical protein